MICKFFKKKKPANDYGNSKKLKIKWGIIVPHTKEAQGAVSKLTKVSEYKYGKVLISYLSTYPFATRDAAGIKGAVKELVSKGCNASLEPHKNAFNNKAKGYEILVIKGDNASKEYARLILEAFEDEYPNRRNRGIKEVSKGDRGYYNLKTAKKAGIKVALLSEMFFIDNPVDYVEPQTMAAFWQKVLINA